MVQTQTIDYSLVRKILSTCPYYDSIVNYEYEEGDSLSQILIDWYRDLIFSADPSDERQLKIISAIDKSLYLYVKDKKYKKGLSKLLDAKQVSLDNQNSIRNVIKTIVFFTNSFQKEEVLDVSNSRWI